MVVFLGGRGGRSKRFVDCWSEMSEDERTLAGLGGRVAARRALMLLDVHGAAS